MQQRLRSLAGSILCALTLGAVIFTLPAAAAPSRPVLLAQVEQMVSVELSQPTPAVTPAGPLRLGVTVSITAPAEYLEVRVRMYGPSGRLVYQKTEVRPDMPPGRHVIGFEHDIEPLGIAPGRYPIEVRVLASGSEPTTHASRLLVVPADARPLPVALVVRLSDLPSVTSDGRLSRDPAAETRLRDDVAFLSQLALDRRVPFALAIPPILIEQLARVVDGYETADGVAAGPESEIAGRYARALDDLRSALATGTIDLVDVPYAQPDLAGLEALDAPDDLSEHWALGDTVNATVLGTDGPPQVAFLGDAPTPSALLALGRRGASAVLVAPEMLRAEEGTATPGTYTVPGSSVRLLAVDAEVASAATAGRDAFYDALFDRLGARDAVVVALDVGPDTRNVAAEAQRVLDWVTEAAWLDAARLDAATAQVPVSAALGTQADSSAPRQYWTDVGDARSAVAAYSAAAGPDDPDGSTLTRSILTAESALWAGGDQRWARASDGLRHARDALDYVTDQFALVTIDAKDVTLSASKGDVPLALTNGTGKPLDLTLVASAEWIRLPRPTASVRAEIADNFVTVPVDLGTIIADELRVTVFAGEMPVAETTVRVRASHLDRLATVGMVVLVLIGLLLFIRRRVRAAIAGTIAVTDDDTDG